jgi:hypothetical protein
LANTRLNSDIVSQRTTWLLGDSYGYLEGRMEPDLDGTYWTDIVGGGDSGLERKGKEQTGHHISVRKLMTRRWS